MVFKKKSRLLVNEKPSDNCCPWENTAETCNSINCLTQQHASEIETLLNIQQAITSHLNLEDVLQMIVDEARKLTSAGLSFLYVLDEGELTLAAVSGSDHDNDMIGFRFPVNNSMAGKSMILAKPMMVTGLVEDDPRIFYQALKPFGKISCYMTVPLNSGNRPIGVIAVADNCDGTLEENSLRVLSMLAPSASIGIENARLYQEQQERRLEAESRHQMAESLRVMLEIVNSDRSLEEILSYIVTHVSGRLLGCQAMAILTLNSKDGSLSVQAAHGLLFTQPGPHSLPGYDLACQVILTRKADYATNASIENNFDRLAQDELSAEWAMAGQLITVYHSWLAVPLVSKDEVFGAILMYYAEPQTFSNEELNLALMFSDEVALAIGNARLRFAAEQAAVIAERNRLARELHDAVSQTLFSASLIAEVIPRLWEKDQTMARTRLEELRHLTRGALAEMRTLLFELRPSVFKEAKLGDLLKHLTQAISIQAQIPITLTIEGSHTLPSDVQIAFYRITQEALSNVIKHSDALNVLITLSYFTNGIKLLIVDDGKGFDPDAVSPDHFGLSIMQERASTIDAAVTINSKPGNGTQIEVTWSGPYPQEQS
jgi:signal transduction histidine kinase